MSRMVVFKGSMNLQIAFLTVFVRYMMEKTLFVNNDNDFQKYHELSKQMVTAQLLQGDSLAVHVFHNSKGAFC